MCRRYNDSYQNDSKFRSATAYDIVPFRFAGLPSIFVVTSEGELFVQPGHVEVFGDETIGLLQRLDGTPGLAYVAVRSGGYRDCERVKAENNLFFNLSWLKTIPAAKDCDFLEKCLVQALKEYAEIGASCGLMMIRDIEGLVGVEGLSNVSEDS